LRDQNPSADRLLSLIDPDSTIAKQRKVAELLQARYRGWKGRERFQGAKAAWELEAEAREAEYHAKLAAKRRAEEEEKRRKRRLLGLDPLDQPERYPWDSR